MRRSTWVFGTLFVVAGLVWAVTAACATSTDPVEEEASPAQGAASRDGSPSPDSADGDDSRTAGEAPPDDYTPASASQEEAGTRDSLPRSDAPEGGPSPPPGPSNTGSEAGVEPHGPGAMDGIDDGDPGLAYAALGDSLSTGLLAAVGYVDRHHAHLERDNGGSVALVNLGVNGMTSRQLLTAIREDEEYREAVRTADVITLNIGGNDFLHARAHYKDGTCAEEACVRAAAAEFKANWDAIIQEVLELRSVEQATVRTMNVYYPFVAMDQADGTFDVFSPYVDELNAHMCERAERHGIPCADVYTAFNGEEGEDDPVERGYITFDGIHPTDTGHRIIADLLRELD